MESIDENLIIDLIENQKLSYEQVSSILKERYPGVWGLSSRSVGRLCSKRSISSRVSIEKVTEIVMDASCKVISAFWLWCVWRNSGKFFHYRFKIFHSYFMTFKNTYTPIKNRKESFKKMTLAKYGFLLSILTCFLKGKTITSKVP